MAQAMGINAYMAFQKETAFGVDPVSPNGRKLYFSSEDIKLSRPLESIDMFGVPVSNPVNISGRDTHRVAAGKVDVSGGIKTHLQANQLGNLIYGGMGTVNTTNNNGIRTHVIEFGQVLPSYVVEVAHPDITLYKHLNGAMVNKLTFNFKQSGFDEVAIDLMGASCVYNSSVWDATLVDLGYSPFSSENSINLLEIAGVPYAYITELSFSIDNQLDGDTHVIGGGIGSPRTWICHSIARVSGSVKALFVNSVLYARALGHTATSISVVRARGTGDGSLNNEQIQFYLQKCYLSPKSPAVTGPKGILAEFDFEGVENITQDPSSSLVVTLVNTESALTG